MPINDYNEYTFVAFLDISGFKKLMLKEEMAWKALDKLYQLGYEILRNQQNPCRVEGIFISDCGVLFIRGNDNASSSTSECLKSLLTIIKEINKSMIEHDFMLTTSIAYGKFKYQERIEFVGIEKNQIYGNAYISAFLDNEIGKPKIQPGQCRIVKKNLPGYIIETFKQQSNDDIFRMVREQKGDNKHYYYYWMVENPTEIEIFEQNYKDTYNIKYAGILKALKSDYRKIHN
jgi:hypothetical protein